MALQSPVAQLATAARVLVPPVSATDSLERVPLAVWPCAQVSAQYQRAGRYVPASSRHPGKMLPELARRLVVWLAQELMEAEVTAAVGAAYGERSADRLARRNGYRERAWDTRVGSIELAIPSSGQARTSRASWSRAAALSRHWSRWSRRPTSTGCRPARSTGWWEALGLAGVSKDTVSRLCRGLDEQVTAFRQRPLKGAYPYLWLDAKVEKVRAGGRVEHRVLVVAYGVDATGQRELITDDNPIRSNKR